MSRSHARVLRGCLRTVTLSLALLIVAGVSGQAQDYDLLLKGGHVIDARNKISAIRDVAMKDGRIAAVATNIDPRTAFKVIDVSGLYVTPGIIDIHFHAYAGGTYPRGIYPEVSPFGPASPRSPTLAAPAGAPSTTSRRASSTARGLASSRSSTSSATASRDPNGRTT